MLEFLDLFGTFIFGLSGAFRAVKYELDLLGVLILSLITGVGGGMIRDVLIGSTPTAALLDERYILLTIIAGLLVFFWSKKLAKQWKKIIVSDAIGLGVFTAIGVSKALTFHLGPIGAVMMGVITATGGGMLRDIIVQEVPAVVSRDFYATASIIGGFAFIIARHFGLSDPVQITISIIVTTFLRLLAMYLNFSLPKVKKLDKSPSKH